MPMKPDYEALFRASPYPYLVMDNELTIIAANDSYLRSVGRTEADIVGRYAFEAFPPNPNDPGSTNMLAIKNSLETAITTGKQHATSFLRYSLPNAASDGGYEERYWSTFHTPVLDEHGRTAFVFQNAIDVTHLYKFDKSSNTAAVELSLDSFEDTEKFNRAQMHQAITRILNDERSHLRNLFNQAPGFVTVMSGPNHVFEMVNEAYYQLVGYRDLIGKPVWVALPEARKGFEEVLDNVYKTGKSWKGHGLKVMLQRVPDGPLEERYVDLVYQPYFAADGSITGIFTQGQDVTEAFEAQAAQRESEERLQEGMVAAKMVVWDWDAGTRRIYFSDNVLEVLGQTAVTIDEVYESIHPEDRQRMAPIHQQAIANRGSYSETLRYTRPDNGRMVWLDIRGTVRADAAGNTFVRGVTLDVTERVEAEKQLLNADRRKDEFLAMLAHELRNPLAPISSAAQLMKLVRLDDDKLKQTSDIIMRQIGHITGLVDDLIDVSRVTRGLINTEQKKLDVKRIISDAVEQTGPAMESKSHHLRVELAPEAAYVLGDQKRLVQVLANVLNNAAKYTPAGGKIVLRMEVDAEQVSIKVVDNGIGISDELLPRVFELFAQGERTSDRSQGGLGVGLALVKSLVELHGGKVTATSAGANAGSIFTILLPRLQEAHEQFMRDQFSAGRDAQQKQLRIMVVDDNVDAAEMLGLLLEASGHEVIIEHSAHAALERIATATPDLFLLDIGLPEMDGNELARQLRSHPATATSTLVAVTGYGQEQDRQKTKAAGFDHHLVKPVEADQLMTLLADIADK